MSLNHDFYCQRAVEARRAASDAKLDNFRDRHLGAAAAWDAMADRAARTHQARIDTEERKAAAKDLDSEPPVAG